MTPGLLSVILLNYNHANVIVDQLRASLTQSYRHFELITTLKSRLVNRT